MFVWEQQTGMAGHGVLRSSFERLRADARARNSPPSTRRVRSNASVQSARTGNVDARLVDRGAAGGGRRGVRLLLALALRARRVASVAVVLAEQQVLLRAELHGGACCVHTHSFGGADRPTAGECVCVCAASLPRSAAAPAQVATHGLGAEPELVTQQSGLARDCGRGRGEARARSLCVRGWRLRERGRDAWL